MSVEQGMSSESIRLAVFNTEHPLMRLAVRAALERDTITLSEIARPQTKQPFSDEDFAYLLSHDSVYGTLPNVYAEGENIAFNGRSVPLERASIDPHLHEEGTTGLRMPTRPAWADLDRRDPEALLSLTSLEGHYKPLISGVDVLPRRKDLSLYHAADGLSHAYGSILGPLADLVPEPMRDVVVTAIEPYSSGQELTDRASQEARTVDSIRSAASNLILTGNEQVEHTLCWRGQDRNRDNFSRLRNSLPIPRVIQTFSAPVRGGAVVTITGQLNPDLDVDTLVSAWNDATSFSIETIDHQITSSDVIRNPHAAVIPTGSIALRGYSLTVQAWYDPSWSHVNRALDLLEASR